MSSTASNEELDLNKSSNISKASNANTSMDSSNFDSDFADENVFFKRDKSLEKDWHDVSASIIKSFEEAEISSPTSEQKSFSFYESSRLSTSSSTSDLLDSSLADFEDAALAYASLQISRHNSTDCPSSDYAASCDRPNNHFLVQSKGWLPVQYVSGDPEANSSSVEACIRRLSSRQHRQLQDGVGCWGEGKDMLLSIEAEHLKLLDPLTHVELHSQLIKHIRVWGVGCNDNSEFAFAAKDERSRAYKCHVFQCDDCGPTIAEQLHVACTSLSKHSKNDQLKKKSLALATPIPRPVLDTKDFEVSYLGCTKVDNFTGMDVLKKAITNVTKDSTALPSVLSVNNASVTIQSDGCKTAHCRIRCISFMGLGDDPAVFAFICVVGTKGVCHVVRCEPSAYKLCLSVQEACCIRYQKAVDSADKQRVEGPQKDQQGVTRRWSLKKLVSSMFSSTKSVQRNLSNKSHGNK